MESLKMKRIIKATLWLALIIPTLSFSATSQGYLHASGLYIADANNNTIILRGMGLGGWLVPEGYMIGTSSSANSPTAFLNAVVGVVGSANATQFFDLYRSKYVQRKDIDSLARWGFNSIRLPMHYGLLSPSPGVYTESGFVIIDSLLSWCEANHLYLILDMHCAPGGQNKDNISDYQGFPALWESSLYQQWTAEIWKTLAARYSTKTWIGGYDLLNETAWTFPSGNGPLRDLLKRITDSIRTVDRNHMIFAEGNTYATDFSSLTPAWDDNMAWSFHKYWNQNILTSISNYISLRASSGRPLWLGESGENSNQWFSDAITLCEMYNIGWSWWTLKKIESVSCPLSATKSPLYDGLLTYWNNPTLPKPSVTDAMNALTAQANLLDASFCTYHPDFINAMFGTPGPNQRKPYADNVIPGVIHAVNYDMGKNGVAYFDVDYQNNGSGTSTYNSGWSFRNDGVDIEKCSDPGSIGYDVGWTSAGEFLAYAVSVTRGGTYNISLRAASPSGGTVKLDWDGVETYSFAVPNTGGWQNWQSIDLGNFHFDAGVHDLHIGFVTGGYNVNRLTFTLMVAGVEESHEIPASYSLEQNYPNPFNPSTVIRYGLPRQSQVTLTVFSLLGQEVARLVRGKEEAGYHEVSFDARALPSGIYVCRIEAGNFMQSRKMMLVK